MTDDQSNPEENSEYNQSENNGDDKNIYPSFFRVKIGQSLIASGDYSLEKQIMGEKTTLVFSFEFKSEPEPPKEGEEVQEEEDVQQQDPRCGTIRLQAFEKNSFIIDPPIVYVAKEGEDYYMNIRCKVKGSGKDPDGCAN